MKIWPEIGMCVKRESVAVLWRDLKVSDAESFEGFVSGGKFDPIDTSFDRIYTNGSHTLSDPKGKIFSIEETMARLMFEN